MSNILKNKCISCGSELTSDVVFIGDQYPSAIFLKDNTHNQIELKSSSLNLCTCSNEECQLI